MNPDSMSMKLVELENRIRARVTPGPAADFREGVMGRVAGEIGKQRQSRIGRWDIGYWAAAAAAILIVLNVSMMRASQDEFSIGRAWRPGQVTAEIQTIRQLETQEEGMAK
jgi:hypothetical protein